MTPTQRVVALVDAVFGQPSEDDLLNITLDAAICELGDMAGCARLDARDGLCDGPISALQAELNAWRILEPPRSV